jgi:FMN hydrolase / 5-amino-6-(5-phospho-D-ribitylamino)uracil phosphatase
MKNISDIKVISVDLFRTLVKVDDGYDFIWRAFLGEKYTRDLGMCYWDKTTEILLAKLDQAAAGQEPFKNVKTIFTDSYAQYFQEIKVDFSPEAAAEMLFEVHKLEHFYEDAALFLEAVKKHYQVCLSTDADSRMLNGIERLFKFEKIFVSEELRAYKANPRFFNQVLAYFQVEPHNILHIGDARADILTPAKMGLQTCWLNRHGKVWQYEIKPDYEVSSLLEVLDILKP